MDIAIDRTIYSSNFVFGVPTIQCSFQFSLYMDNKIQYFFFRFSVLSVDIILCEETIMLHFTFTRNEYEQTEPTNSVKMEKKVNECFDFFLRFRY